jgi:uncharacterized protein
MVYLLDAGFLFALVDKNDLHHLNCYESFSKIHGKIILPVPAITETAYLVKRECGIEPLAIFLEMLGDSTFDFEAPTSQDYKRSAEIIRKYDDANIDFVDACIVSMAERLNVSKILTVDRRHFQIFKPEHCESFEILP